MSQPVPSGAAPAGERPIGRRKLFISYAHADQVWKERFLTMLAPATGGNLEIWSDDRIAVGSDWLEEIERQLNSASIALLLVSEHFLASEFVTRVEVNQLLARHRSDGMRLYWVPVRPALFEQSPFASIQSPWSLKAPLLSLDEGEQAHAIREICARLVEDAGTLVRLSEARHSRLQDAVQAVAERWHIRIERLLGSGDAAVTYLGTMERKPVVVKALVDESMRCHLKDLEGELERAGGLRDTCFSRLEHTMLDSDPPCLVLEYVDADTVGRVLRAAGPIPPDTVLRLIAALARGLHEYHEAGLLYGPLVADDVFYDKRNATLRLPALNLSSRFAIGSPVDGGFPRDLRAATYLAPEQYRGRPYTSRTDQYALALLAVEMLLGEPPLRVRCAADLEKKSRFFNDPEPCIAALARLHPTFAELLHRMLCVDPDARFASMAEVAAEIELLEPASNAFVTHSYLAHCMGRPEFYRAFYTRFLACCPRAVPLFAGIDMTRQGRMLDEAIDLLLGFTPANRIDAKKLQAIAAKEGHRGVTAAELDQFGQSLLDTLADFGNEPPEVLAAWQAVLRPGLEFLRGRIGRDPAA